MMTLNLTESLFVGQEEHQSLHGEMSGTWNAKARL
jgi:hypothetical protein